jgi:hypothetical protein
MENSITDQTIAVVFAQGGEVEDYVACETWQVLDFAVDEFEGFGAKAVVFYRDGHQRPDAAHAKPRDAGVVNNASGVTGNLVQCDRIDGGVRF